MVVYGIKNCDTVKKARAWLDRRGLVYRFHNLRGDGLPPERLQAWVAALGWETLLNRRGTTWRRLPEAERADLNAERAVRLMLAHPTLIKRPVLEHPAGVLVGFSEADYAQAFV